MTLVTVGVPVRNGGAALDEALHALRAQRHTELEILVCENASQDETVAVAARHVSDDPRVRLIPAPEPLSAVENFNRCVALARGSFFMWAAHDDLMQPDFVSACLQELLRTGAPACVTDAVIIDASGAVTAERKVDRRLAQEDLGARLRAHVRARDWLEVYALYRTSELASLGEVLTDVPGPDVLLTWRLLQRQPLAIVPSPLFSYRRTQAGYKSALQTFGAVPTRRGGRTHHALNARLWVALWAASSSVRARYELLLALGSRGWLRRLRDDLYAELALRRRP